MTHTFDAGATAGILRHMNEDHAGDSLLIARAFAVEDAVAATMTGLDGDAGTWLVERADGSHTEVRVAWPQGAISERPEVRREIVALYRTACERLGVTPR